MVYTIPAGLRDREYNKFLSNTGSLSSLAVSIVGGSVHIGSVSANVDAVYIQSGDNVNVISARGDTNYTKGFKQAVRHAIGSTGMWGVGAGSKVIISDILVSVGSITLDIEAAVYAGGSEVMHAYLASHGGFVSNLQTPFETQTNGSIFFETLGIGSVSATIMGFEAV